MPPDSSRSSITTDFLHRVRQIGYALRYRTPPELPAELIADIQVRKLFQTLGPHDQRHLLEVHRLAEAAGLTDAICHGALLHDIGKARLSGSQMSVAGRTWHVLFGRFAPEWELRLSTMRLPVISNELYLAHNHAAIGAARLEALGLPPAVCDVVRHHDATDVADPAMKAMQEIDSATP